MGDLPDLEAAVGHLVEAVAGLDAALVSKSFEVKQLVAVVYLWIENQV